MPGLSVEFGFHPRRLEIEAGDITVATLPDQPEKAARIKEHLQIEGDWIYAPPELSRDSMTAEIVEKPYARRVFGLPKTHDIAHKDKDADNKDHLEFLVWVLGFFTGLRLTTEEAGFIDATPVKPITLVDFLADQANLRKGLELAECFWRKNSAKHEQAKRFQSAIHALFMAQNPLYLEHERFLHLYIAFDACYALLKHALNCGKHITHKKRVSCMCEHFGISVPCWANPSESGIADLRNAIVHEGLSSGEPLGFRIDGFGTHGDLTLQMQALICRLLVAIIGGETSDYVKTPVDTRQIHGLDLE